MPTVHLIANLEALEIPKKKDPLCKECNNVQSVTHVLLTCKNKDLTKNRTLFENKTCKYVRILTQEIRQTVFNYKLLCKI